MSNDIHAFLEAWSDSIIDMPPSYMESCDVVLQQPIFVKGALEYITAQNGRPMFEVKLEGDERPSRKFRKRRLAKKYMRQQLARTKQTMLRNVVLESVGPEGDSSCTFTFNYANS